MARFETAAYATIVLQAADELAYLVQETVDTEQARLEVLIVLGFSLFRCRA